MSGAAMRTATILLMSALMSTPAFAQSAAPPPLDYVAVPDSFSLPAGMTLGSTSGVAINSKGHIVVLHRGPDPMMEFDPGGKFVRAFGNGFFDRPHGLRIDAQDNIWATDVATHVVYKFSPEGRILLVLGVRGNAGEMHPYGHLRLFNEPNDLAFGPTGDIFVVQGHGRGEPKSGSTGRQFHQGLGQEGTGPGRVRHDGIAIDAKGLIYVADRNNQRIQVFDADGTHLRDSKHPGTPCGLFITPDQHLWLAHGHAGQVLKLDLDGKVLGAMGRQGKALGQFGEAHFIAVNNANGDIYVADTLNWRVQKFVRKEVASR
jgi:DNA-binding beta-propeller fold protein YncE